MTGSGWQKITSVFLLGVGVGAGLGILFAPKSGEETRDAIVGGVQDGLDEVVAQGQKLGQRAQKTLDDAKEHVRDAAQAGGQAYKEAKASSS